jgi:glycosyltransferase involved in cell wall biosynthesis
MFQITSSVSVVICAYTSKRWDDLLAAIASVQRQSFAPLEIILVIDHNRELFELAQAQIPGVLLIENTQTPGLSGARNSGIAVAQGDFIAFLDDDARADPHWLELMLKCCQDPQVLGAGGIVVPLWSGKPPTWFPREFYWVIGCSYQDFGSKVTRVRNAYGGNICVRREVFDAIGGFRTDLGRTEGKSLPLGGEETELCIRAVQRWPEKFFLCDPNAISQHHIPLQRMNKRYFRSRCYAEGLSKAAVSQYTGMKDGLAAEQEYTRQALPRGVMRGIHDGLHGDLAGLARAWMILVGLTTTIAGYLAGRASNTFRFQTRKKEHAHYAVTMIGPDREKDISC